MACHYSAIPSLKAPSAAGDSVALQAFGFVTSPKLPGFTPCHAAPRRVTAVLAPSSAAPSNGRPPPTRSSSPNHHPPASQTAPTTTHPLGRPPLHNKVPDMSPQKPPLGASDAGAGHHNVAIVLECSSTIAEYDGCDPMNLRYSR